MTTHVTRRMLLAVVACAASPAFAQVPPPAPPASPPAYGATAAPVAAGRIMQFLINPNGDVDGLLLADGTQVNFPPHLSQALLQIAKVGDAVSIQGVRGYGAEASVHATSITNAGTGRRMVDQPPAPGLAPSAPAVLTPLSANARVSRVLYAERGEMNGAILDDGMIVRFPPHIGVQMQNLLRPNAQLAASGYGTENAYGRALEATSLSVDGQSPIAVYGPDRAPGPVP
jgi:hypothetical protein